VLYALLFAACAAVGFGASRVLRRPVGRAQAAATARSLAGPLGSRRGLTAPELQRACFSEMVRHVRVSRDGRTSAPGRYLLLLAPADLAVVDESRRWFTDGLATALRDAAGRNGWTIDGPVHIDCQADPGRRPGVPAVDAHGAHDAHDAHGAPDPADRAGGDRVATGPSGPGRRPAAPTPALALLRADTGERVPLRGASVTIGRSPENTVSSLDERISRTHARLEPAGGGWVIVDNGSANGTWVDGTRIAPRAPVPVRVGTAIGIGPLQLRVTSDGAVRPSGTRALADADRTRISAEVLGRSPARRP
jgi:hypothetical protein